MKNIDELEKLIQEIVINHADKNSPDYNECDTSKCDWCEESQCHLEEIKNHLESLEYIKKGVDDITHRIRSMSPDEYESMLKDCLSRLKEYNFSLSDDLNAFHTLKKSTAMLLSWEKYWNRIKEIN